MEYSRDIPQTVGNWRSVPTHGGSAKRLLPMAGKPLVK
jgi:hypothetical protein